MSGWPAWRTADHWGVAEYASTRAEEFLPGIPRRRLGAGPDGRRAVARALYEVVRAQDIEYELERYHPSEAHQEIRTPAEILASPRKATCLDLALLYSGLALANELLPVVVVLDGHALVMLSMTHGLRQWEEHRPGLDAFMKAPVTDPEKIRRLVDSDAFVAVECTGLAHVHRDPSGVLGAEDRVDGYLSFDAAVEHGGRRLRESLPLLFAVDVAVARAKGFGELDFAPGPTGPPRAEVDEYVIPHPQAISELDARRRYLRDDELTFLTPGTDHPTEPANLLRRLSNSEAGRGVMLLGPAGAGKTRTCQEVATRAFGEGWRVLHVRPDTRVTTDHVEQAVLRDPSARTLLVLDYLDVCANIEIDELNSQIARPVERAGGLLALIATSRPARLAKLRERGTDDVLDYLDLRIDDEFSTSVAGHIFREVAPQALATLGMARLAEVCGRRPVIALLIARDVERLVLAGEPVQTGPRSNVLLKWLRDRLVKDGLLPDPRAPGASDPFADAPSEPMILAFALTAALTPRPRLEVERLIQRLFDGHGVDRSSRSVIDVLTTMGWTEQVDDLLEIAHDVVTDELLVAAVAPRGGLRVHDTQMHALLDAVADTPAALDRVASNVARVHADLGTDKTAQLERACGDWIRTHGQALGLAFAASPAGGHALYTLLHAAPWQQTVSACWGDVVEPWLAREFGVNDRIDFMAYSLRTIPEPHAGPIITAAMVWLAGHWQRRDADIVLRHLLRRPDLSTEAGVVVDYALRWLATAPERDVTYVLRGLLQLDLGDERRWQQVLEVCAEWAQRSPLPAMADYALRPLVRHATPGIREVVINAALGWLDTYGLESRAVFVLRPLLNRADLTATEREGVCNRSLDWLDRHGRLADATYVLRPLLGDARYSSSTRSPEAVEWARRWVLEHGTEESASYLYPRLLTSAQVTDDEARQYIGKAFAWLDLHAGATTDVTYVLRGLLGRAAWMDTDDALGQEIVRRACEWLRGSPPEPEQAYVLVALLSRLRSYDEVTADVIINLARRWMDANPAHDSATRVLATLLTSPRLADAARDELLDHALMWLRQHPADPAGAHVLRTLLYRIRTSGVDPDRTALIVTQAFAWLREIGTHEAQGSVLAPLLTSEAVDAGRKVDAVRTAMTWLQAHLDDVAAGNVLSAVFGFRSTDTDHAARDRLGEPIAGGGAGPPPGPGSAGSVDSGAEIAATLGERAHRWLEAQPGDPASSGVLQAVLAAVAAVDPAGSVQAVHVALVWLGRNWEHPTANHVFQQLVSVAQGPDRQVLADLPDQPTVLPVLAALVSKYGRDLDALHTAVAAGVAWLGDHPAQPAAIFVRQAILRGGVAEPRYVAPVVESTLTWLADNPDHTSATWTLQALLTARGLGAGQPPLIASAALAWLDSHPDHAGVNAVLQALLNARELDATHIARAGQLALQWLDTHPGDPPTPFVLRAVLGARGLDRRLLAPAVDRAFVFIDTGGDHDAVNHVLQAVLGANELDQPRLRLAADAALAWVQEHARDQGAPHLLQAMLTAKLPTWPHTARAIDAALIWLEENSSAPNLNYLLRAVFEVSDLSADRAARAADAALVWLAHNRDTANANYVLQAPLKAKQLDTPRLTRAADETFAWLARHQNNVGTPFVLRTLLTNNRLPDEYRARAADVTFEWMGRYPVSTDLPYALRGLLTAKQLDEGRKRRAVEMALDWLSRYRRRSQANFVLQDLLTVQIDDPAQVDRTLQETLTWLTASPTVRATPFVLRAACTAKSLDATHAAPLLRMGIKWIQQNPGFQGVDNVVQGLLDCPVLADPTLATIAQEIVEATFGWLSDSRDTTRGYVILALLRCRWLGTDDAERVTAAARSALSEPSAMAKRHSVIVALLHKAEQVPEPGAAMAGLVALALVQAGELSPSDRAAVYTGLSKVDAVPVEALDQILDWLSTDEAEPHRWSILAALLGRPSLEDGRRRRAIGIAVQAVSRLPGRAGAGIVAVLPPLGELTPAQGEVVESWLDDNLPDLRDPVLLSVLVRRRDFAQPRQDAVRHAAIELVTDADDARDHSPLVAVLAAEPALADDDLDRLVASLTGRPAFAALLAALAARRGVSERHRQLVERQLADACAQGDQQLALAVLQAAFGRRAIDGGWASLRAVTRRCIEAHPEFASGITVPEEDGLDPPADQVEVAMQPRWREMVRRWAPRWRS